MTEGQLFNIAYANKRVIYGELFKDWADAEDDNGKITYDANGDSHGGLDSDRRYPFSHHLEKDCQLQSADIPAAPMEEPGYIVTLITPRL